jgi:SAM-dependent methyltransferase
MYNKYKQEDWDEYYEKEKSIHIKSELGFFSSYDIYLCQSILKNYLFKKLNSNNNKLTICEIGSGDGKLVKQLSHLLNCTPFGIEYSRSAAKIAEKEGVNTIIGDAFDTELLEKYKENFDLVYSYGFIEHIIPPEKAVDIHLSLLKKGGYFFIQIPRLKGFNHLKARIFRPDLLPLHNLEIMEEESLRKVCLRENVQEIFCKKYGTFKLRLPLAKKNIRWLIMRLLSFPDQYILSPLFKLFFGKKGFETQIFSPAVIFIGKKI